MQCHISDGNSKIGPMLNWSVMPILTCSACARRTCGRSGCYALNSAGRTNVLRAWRENTEIAKRHPQLMMSAWRAALDADPTAVVRIHVGGDFFSVPYFLRWLELAEEYPTAKFFAFTKQFAIVRKALAGRRMPRNFALILSAWMMPDGTILPPPADLMRRFPVAWMRRKGLDVTSKRRLVACTGDCQQCGKCFQLKRSDGFDIVFDYHGRGIKANHNH